jgi:hypothetical protein
VSRVRATGMDLVPTMRDLAGKPIEKAADPDAQTAVEGGSLVPVLKSSGENAGKGTVARTREEIVIHFPHDDLNNGGPASAIYLGDYKLVRNYDAGTVKLYDIAKDRAEGGVLGNNKHQRVHHLLPPRAVAGPGVCRERGRWWMAGRLPEGFIPRSLPAQDQPVEILNGRLTAPRPGSRSPVVKPLR